MIYILAQGGQSRWTMRHEGEFVLPSEYKQLVPVMEVPNLFRTVEIVRQYTQLFQVIAEGIIFTSEQVDSLSNQIRTLRVAGNILHGIFQLLEPNKGYTFLLGDVIFSKQLLADILTYDERTYTLWGRHGKNIYTGKKADEIFALTISSEFVPLVKTQLSYLKELRTKLWDFYHSPMYAGNWEECTDWTDDIDSPQEYEKYFHLLEEFAKNEIQNI